VSTSTLSPPFPELPYPLHDDAPPFPLSFSLTRVTDFFCGRESPPSPGWFGNELTSASLLLLRRRSTGSVLPECFVALRLSASVYPSVRCCFLSLFPFFFGLFPAYISLNSPLEGAPIFRFCVPFPPNQLSLPPLFVFFFLAPDSLKLRRSLRAGGFYPECHHLLAVATFCLPALISHRSPAYPFTG